RPTRATPFPYTTLFRSHADLLDIATQGTQQGRLAPMDARQQNQPVEGVVLRLTVPDRSEGAAEQLIDILDVQLGIQRVAEHEVMDPERLAVIPGDLERKLAQYPQAQVVQHRHHVGQRQRTAEMIELAV